MGIGTQIEFQLWPAPLANAAVRDLAEFLQHKGRPWIDDIRRRLSGGLPGARDFFCVARQQNEFVGHVWYTTFDKAPELGLIGHVFTAPDFRRRGISARLMEMALADFRQRGGRAMQLFTSTPYTLAFYARFGFARLYNNEAYHATDWYMCSPADSYAQLQHATAAVRGEVRPLSPGMLPQFCLLYNLEWETHLKNRAQQVGLGLEAELAFIQTWHEIDTGQTVCYCHGDEQLLTGIATLSRLEFPHQSHLAIFDVYTAPRCQEQIAALADACLSARDKRGVEIVYAFAVDVDKCRTFERLGFQPRSVLPRHFRIAAQRYDVHVYELSR